MELRDDALHVQHDFGHIFFHTVDSRNLMKHPVDLDRSRGISLQRTEQDTTQGVGKRDAIASCQRLYHELAFATIFVESAGCNRRLLYFNHG